MKQLFFLSSFVLVGCFAATDSFSNDDAFRDEGDEYEELAGFTQALTPQECLDMRCPPALPSQSLAACRRANEPACRQPSTPPPPPPPQPAPRAPATLQRDISPARISRCDHEAIRCMARPPSTWPTCRVDPGRRAACLEQTDDAERPNPGASWLATLYDGTGFGGAYRHVAGETVLLDPAELRIGNDRVSSLEVAQNACVVLAEGQELEGRWQTFGPGRHTSVTTMDNRASSLFVYTMRRPGQSACDYRTDIPLRYFDKLASTTSYRRPLLVTDAFQLYEQAVYTPREIELSLADRVLRYGDVQATLDEVLRVPHCFTVTQQRFLGSATWGPAFAVTGVALGSEHYGSLLPVDENLRTPANSWRLVDVKYKVRFDPVCAAGAQN